MPRLLQDRRRQLVTMPFCVRPGQARLACIDRLSHMPNTTPATFFCCRLSLAAAHLILSVRLGNQGSSSRASCSLSLGKMWGIKVIFTPSRVSRIRFLSTTLSVPIKTASPLRLLRILPWYRQIMMPCRTATITYEESRQVTNGDGPGVGRAPCGCEGLFSFFAVPQLLQGPDTDLRCGICWEPRFVEPPPSKVLLLASCQGCLLGNSGSISSHWPRLPRKPRPRKPQKAKADPCPAKPAGVGFVIP